MANLEVLYEDWKYVKGYEGLYIISNRGRLVSFERVLRMKSKLGKDMFVWRRGRYMSYGFDGYYHYVFLSNSPIKKKKCHIHRLVAETYIPNPENKPQVNHKDGNKLNNCLYNLEWNTASENLAHSIRTGLRPALSTGKFNELHPKSRPVEQYTYGGVLVKVFPSAMEAERQGFMATKITAACKGRRPNHKKFIWRYA